jgi:hypothetical protein
MDGTWSLESGNRVARLNSGTIFEVEGEAWRFSCVSNWEPTVRTQRLRLIQESTFQFDVSSDEEQVVLVVELQQEQVSMGRLSGYYMLLTLARLRHEDTLAGHDDSEAGWVHREDLANMLRCSEQQINLWVHRIRSRFSGSGFLDYSTVVQRRDGSGQMRIGTPRCVFNQSRGKA